MKINENRESGADQFSKDYNMEQLRDKLQTVMDTGDGSTLTTPKGVIGGTKTTKVARRVSNNFETLTENEELV